MVLENVVRVAVGCYITDGDHVHSEVHARVRARRQFLYSCVDAVIKRGTLRPDA